MNVANRGFESINRKSRRVILARAHETLALLLAAGMLVAAGDQLRQLRWGVWASPLIPSAILALAAGITVWTFPAIPAWLHRSLVWGSLALATPTAFASMTTIDFSLLLACQLLLIAAVVPEVAQKRRVALFLWLVPMGTVATVLAYVHSFMAYRPL